MNDTNTDTETATKTLARIWELGGFSDAAMAIERCKAYCRNWRLADANSAIKDAYRALGAASPAVPLTALHAGQHPVQIAAR